MIIDKFSFLEYLHKKNHLFVLYKVPLTYKVCDEPLIICKEYLSNSLSYYIYEREWAWPEVAKRFDLSLEQFIDEVNNEDLKKEFLFNIDLLR